MVESTGGALMREGGAWKGVTYEVRTRRSVGTG